MEFADVAALATTLAIVFVGWTASVATFAWWVAGRFRDLEKLIYREMHQHRKEDDEAFHALDLRAMRLEGRVFGWTRSGDQRPASQYDRPEQEF